MNSGQRTGVGAAPAYRESGLEGEGMAAVRSALDMLLTGHEPYPAVVVDRQWNVVTANAAMGVLLDIVPPRLLEPPLNVVRLVMHPEGFAAHCVDFGEVRAHFLSRLLRQVNATGDPELRALYEEMSAYEYGPGPAEPPDADPADPDGAEPGRQDGPLEAMVPLRFRTPHGELWMFSTVATFGAPADVTLSELAVELFFPVDEYTARVLHELGARSPAQGRGATQLLPNR